ncbi:hypothetical protein MMC25_006995 [Agyrium rufum]|nr:hypothetical protein [Agyrium rufum]
MARLNPKLRVSTLGFMRRKDGIQKSRNHRTHTFDERKTSSHHQWDKFSDTVEHSRATIFEEANIALESQHNLVTNRIAIAASKASDEKEKATAISNQLSKPFGESLVSRDSSDGRGIHIAQVMKTFQDTINEEASTMETLWQEWERITLDITDLGRDESSAEQNDLQAPLFTVEKQRLEEEIELWCNQTIKKMLDSEKEMDIHSEKEKRGFLRVVEGIL